MRLEREIDYLMQRLAEPASCAEIIRNSLKQVIGLKVRMTLGQAMLIEQLVDALFSHYDKKVWDVVQLGQQLKAKLPHFIFSEHVPLHWGAQLNK
jgi:hypothetical protein